ncbi:MAG: T9SS type A sorting domain-containing protein [Bacteroidetes bacterium]|nr:T9SS type A sorting domain-containing protein [Bacteroidota bacterium]
MTVLTQRFFLLWTCLLTSASMLLADANPPVLTNPSACGLGLFIEQSCGPLNEFQVDVTTAPGTTLGTNVYLKELRLIIQHDWDADLDIYLKSPSGVLVEVSTDNGDVNSNYGNPNGNCDEYTVFRASTSPGACNLQNIRNAAAPFLGAYLPEGNFADFNDGTSPIGHWTLMVCDDGIANYGYLEFVELVFETTDCQPPTDVTVEEVDSTSAVFSWTKGSTCSNLIFEYGPVGFTPGNDDQPGANGTVIIGSCAMPKISGLAPNSTYEVYLRENCAPGVYSINSCPVQVSTTCSPPPATIVENFNNQALCTPFCGATCPITGPWRNALNDNFDWLVNTDTTITENTGPNGDNPGGGNYIYLEASGSGCTNGKRAMLVSDCIQVVANPDSCDMSFDYHLFGVHIGSLSFEASIDGGVTWATLWTVAGNKGNKWHRKFIDLDDYNGQTVQFRFNGKGGNGKFADLAIDNIVFYGSIDLGFPNYVYYRDADGDGYGTPDQYIASCQPANFPGYVDNDTDCNDQEFYQNPGEQEILCDDFDSNCNGDVDEYFVMPVTTQGSIVCSGGNGFVSAQPVNFGQISWYESLTGGTAIGIGDTLFPGPTLLVNHSLDTLELVFYAEENTLAGCVSNERTPASIIILPGPKLVTSDTPGECLGKTFDLNSVNVNDENGLNGSLSYFDHLPFLPGEEVGPVVTPNATTDYYFVSEAVNGCRDTLMVTYTVQPGPAAFIPDAPTLCRNSTKFISVENMGTGTGPYQYIWNTGSINDSIQIFSDNNLGTVNTYAVTITDAGGCSSADTLAVTTIVNISQIVTASSPVTTCLGSDGTIDLTPLDGTPPFNYTWAGAPIPPQAGGLMLTDLTQGSYAFTVTDSSPEQCRVVVPVVVVNGPAANVEVDNVQHVSCQGGSDGCISLDIIAGQNTTVTWSNNMTGPSICGLTAGTYSATVTEGNCQNVVSNIPVTQPEILSVQSEVSSISCFGGNDGAINLTIFGGTPPLNFQWSNSTGTYNATSPSISGLAAGEYNLTVTDENGCSTVLSQILVDQPSPISLAALGFQQPSCNGQSNGSITVTAEGGTAPYSYVWNNGGSGSTLSNIAAGSYTVTVRDQKSCIFNQSINLTQPQPISITASEIHPPDCAGQTNGYVNINASGGVGNFGYSWSDGSSMQNLMGIGNGTYEVTATDNYGCTATASFGPIASPEIMTAGINQTGPFCIGRDENELEAFVQSGGQPPFSYEWSTDDSGPILPGLSYGQYSVTITDANGCKSIHTTTIDSVQVLVLDYQAFSPLCFGQTGQLAMTVSGGTEPYSILWSDGQTGPVATNLPAQNFAATVHDALGCTNSFNIITLQEPAELVVSLENIEDIACYQGNEGGIDISVSGGTLPYSYQWSNPSATFSSSTEDVSGLSEGSYNVVVTDGNGCVTSLPPLYVDAPDKLVPISNLGVPTGNCQSVQVDNVCVNVNGGIAPFQFAWETGDTTTCLMNPVAGDYHVTITDAAGCTIEFMSVKVPPEYTAINVQQVSTGNEVICAGTNSGQLSVDIQGGAVPYQFNWSNSVHGTTDSQTLMNDNLPTGQYRVTITDNTGCTAVSPLMPISTFGAVNPTIAGSQVMDVHCKGGTDGAIPLMVGGGLVPYSFYWENAAGDSISIDQNLNGVSAGNYHVTVTDQIGCTGTTMTTVFEPTTTFLLDSVVVHDVACFGGNTGSIFALPHGGDLPYHYEWSNMATTQEVSNLPAGNYQLTVFDNNGCERNGTYTVSSPDTAISVTVLDSAGVTCFGDSDGFINIAVSGGTPNYIFNWDAISAEQNLTDVPAGSYMLVIFDSQGCPFTTHFTLGTPPPLQMGVTSSPQTQLIGPNGSATAVASGGTPPIEYYWSNANTGETISDLSSGLYSVTAVDANSCDITGYVTVDFISKTIDNPVGSADFVLYPNPSSGNFTLGNTSKSSHSKLDLRVFNQLGQIVFEENGASLQNENYRFNLQTQPTGIYQVVATTNGKMVFEGKVMIHH